MPLDESPVTHGDNYVRQVFAMLWENLPGVLVGAAFFSLLAAPAFLIFSVGLFGLSLVIGILTVAPSWSALLAYESPLYHERNGSWQLYWAALRRYWRRSVLMGTLAMAPLLSIYFKLPFLDREPVPFILWLGFAVDFLAAAVLASLLLYAFPLMVRADLELGTTLRNAWVLVGRRPANTVGLLAMTILFGFAVVYLSLGLLLFLPAIFGLFVIGNCEAVLQQT